MSSEIRVMSPKIFSQVTWNAEYVARNFILLKNILASLLHIYCTCSVPLKIKECDTVLIDLTLVSLLINGSSVRYITHYFILLVSSHHPFKNNVCYTFISHVLSSCGLKKKILTLFIQQKITLFLCALSPVKIQPTCPLSILGNLTLVSGDITPGDLTSSSVPFIKAEKSNRSLSRRFLINSNKLP